MAPLDPGVRMIVLYKLTKAAVQVVLAGVLGVAIVRGGAAEQVQLWAREVGQHATTALTVYLARALTRASTERGLEWAVIALGVDGVLSAVEGWSLVARKWWGPWLLVVATGVPLPFEAYAMIRYRRWRRVALFVVNTAIVAYMARRAQRHPHGTARAARG